MLRNKRSANNKTPEPNVQQSTNTVDEDVYNFIKRERASQKDLNSTQAHMKIKEQYKSGKSKCNSVNQSLDNTRKQSYIEAVKQEI